MASLFAAAIVILLIKGFFKLNFSFIDATDKHDEWTKAIDEHKVVFESNGRYFLTETGERLTRVYNTEKQTFEYSNKEGKVIYSSIGDWRKEQEKLSENTWNSVFQWDTTEKENPGEIKGTRYKEKSTGHLLVIRTIYVGSKECKVYLDLNTMSYIRRTDGEINRELRYIKYCPENKEMFVDIDKLNKCLEEKTRDLRQSVQMNKLNPKKNLAMLEHNRYSFMPEEVDWSEAKMSWFGTHSDLSLLQERHGSQKTRRWYKYC